jgi:hypothetical protein
MKARRRMFAGASACHSALRRQPGAKAVLLWRAGD